MESPRPRRPGRPAAAALAALLAAAALPSCGILTREKGRSFRITAPVPSRGPGFSSALYQTVAVRMQPGHRVAYVNDGKVFDAVVEAVRGARRSVNVVLFIWRKGEASDRVLAALTERARAGVACRVLVDPTGSAHFERDVKPALEKAGCKAHVFRPLPADETLARNHRKLVIVDGRVGLTGGFAIQDEWLGEARNEKEWRDTNVRVEGPAVAQMQQAFAENWQETTGELLPPEDFPALDAGGALAPAAPSAASGSSEPGGEGAGGWAAFVSSTASPEVTRAERITQLLVQAAGKRLWISQSYFTPNDALSQMLQQKAREGVDVRVLAPGDKNDQPAMTLLQRGGYEPLLAAGVRIWEFEPSMMHAKTMLVDDRLVLVGSINYDALSFNVLEEGSLVVEDAEAARELAATFERDCARAREVRMRQGGGAGTTAAR
jgi:cardiolipin synthase